MTYKTVACEFCRSYFILNSKTMLYDCHLIKYVINLNFIVIIQWYNVMLLFFQKTTAQPCQLKMNISTIPRAVTITYFVPGLECINCHVQQPFALASIPHTHVQVVTTRQLLVPDPKMTLNLVSKNPELLSVSMNWKTEPTTMWIVYSVNCWIYPFMIIYTFIYDMVN